jgi:hypothetical protein
MKKIFVSIAFFGLFSMMNAQRIDLDREYFGYTYRNLPNVALDKSFKTYSVDVDKTVALDMLSNESANSKINIEGLKKVTGKAHIMVNIRMEDLIIESQKVESRTVVNKDKDGKETGRTTYYWTEAVYSFSASAMVNDFNGYKLKSYVLAIRDTKNVYKTSEYGNSSDAANYYNNNRLEIKAKLVSDQINSALNSLNSSLNHDFGFMVFKTNDNFWTLGSKKHEEYAAFSEAIASAKAALESITCDAIPADINDRLKPSIAYFEGIYAKYTDPEDKGQKKLRYAAYYNLAYIYFSIENFDKAAEYCNLLVTNDYDGKDGSRLLEEINAIKADFQKHSVTSRHFHPDIENANPPQ